MGFFLPLQQLWDRLKLKQSISPKMKNLKNRIAELSRLEKTSKPSSGYLSNFPHFTDVCFLIFKLCKGLFNPGNDFLMVSADIWESFREVETWNVYGHRGTAGGFIHRQRSASANHRLQGSWGWSSRLLLLFTLGLKIQWITNTF